MQLQITHEVMTILHNEYGIDELVKIYLTYLDQVLMKNAPNFLGAFL